MTYDQFLEVLNGVEEGNRASFLREVFRDKDMLGIFGLYFFPHIVKVGGDISELHEDLCRELSTPEDSACIVPRGHAKTTWAKIDNLYDIVYGREPVIVYVSNTLQDAQFHFESIKTELENNDRLISVYGNLVPSEAMVGRKWTNKHFETTNGINVIARGAGKGRGVNIKNQRPTKIVMDDIEDDEQVRSADRRKKLSEWVYNVIFPSKDKQRGRIKWIGTVIDPRCEILKFYKRFGGIYRKAIEGGKAIWPEMYSVQDLDEIRRKMGSRVFMQEYMNTPVNEEVAIIKPQWLRYYSTLDQRLIKRVIMMDPQAGEKKGSDNYGLAVVAYHPKDPRRYVERVNFGKASQLHQAALLVRTFQEFRGTCSMVGVEKVLAQVGVYQDVLNWISGLIELPGVDNTNRNIPFFDVSPEGKDKTARLQIHESAFERGEIVLHTSLSDFGEKLVAFPNVEFDDDIDAVLYALEWSYKNSLSLGDSESYNKNESKQRTIVGDIMSKKF